MFWSFFMLTMLTDLLFAPTRLMDTTCADDVTVHLCCCMKEIPLSLSSTLKKAYRAETSWRVSIISEAAAAEENCLSPIFGKMCFHILWPLLNYFKYSFKCLIQKHVNWNFFFFFNPTSSLKRLLFSPSHFSPSPPSLPLLPDCQHSNSKM